MIFAYFLQALCWKHNTIIDTKETQIFYEIVPKDDLQLTIDLNNISPGLLSYRVTEPNGKTEGFKTLLRSNNLLKLTGAGQYTVEVSNIDLKQIYYSIGTYVDKEFEVDEDTRYIKSIIDKLRTDLRNIYNSNLRLKEMKEINLRQVKKDKAWMLLLLILPLFYVFVGFVSLKMQKGFFEPKKK
ncbi:hypothetical protein BDAP_002422 [Binucleata daphniae]